MQTIIIIGMTRRSVLPRRIAIAIMVALPLLLVACSAGRGDESGTGATAAGTGSPACPTTPVPVTVSVDQWGDIVSQLGGQCAKVTTVLASSSVDPHDYEPAPADAAEFTGARLVVINGRHYDEWAAKLADTSAPGAPVVNAADLAGPGDNPHVWYSPATVNAVAEAVTAELSKLAPDARRTSPSAAPPSPRRWRPTPP